MASLKEIFGWFEKGDYPKQKEFEETWKSFWHKSERLPITQIFGLQEEINRVTTNFKGYHTSLDALLIAHPQNKNRKDFYAWVGSPYPGTVYVVKANGGAWTDTGEVPTQQEIDLAEYAKKTDNSGLTVVYGKDGKVISIDENAYSVETENGIISEGANLFPLITDWINGEYIEVSQGNTTTNENYKYSNYFYIKGAKELTARYMLSSGGALYDENKNLINTYGSGMSGADPVENVKITVPDNAVYICHNHRSNWINNSLILSKGEILTSGNSTGKELILNNLLRLNRTSYNVDEEVHTDIIEQGTDLYPLITNWINGYYLNSSGGQVEDNRYKYSNMFYIKGAKKITAKYMFIHGGRIKDIDGNVLSYISAGNVGTIPIAVTFEIPNNAVYLEINIREDWTDFTLILTEGQIGGVLDTKKLYFDNLSFTQRQKSEILSLIGEKDTSLLLEGKVISFLGDSITTYNGFNPNGYNASYPKGDVDSVNKTWWKTLIDSTNAILGVNNSFSGTCIALNNESSTRISVCDDKRLTNLGNPDYIFIFAGTNDFGFKAVPIGEYNFESETQDKTKFKQALTYTCRTLSKLYPNAKVVFLTLPARTDSIFYPKLQASSNQPIHYLYEYNNAIKEIADIFYMNVIDLTKCGINYENASEYLADHVHPNAKGMKLIADYVVLQLSKIL